MTCCSARASPAIGSTSSRAALLNLGHHLSGRLRQTTDALRELGDASG